MDDAANEPFGSANPTSFLDGRGLDKINSVLASETKDVGDPVDFRQTGVAGNIYLRGMMKGLCYPNNGGSQIGWCIREYKMFRSHGFPFSDHPSTLFLCLCHTSTLRSAG